MNSYRMALAVTVIFCISLAFAGCTETGVESGSSGNSENYGSIYIIDQNDLDTVPLFDGQGKIIEIFSPSILEELNIPEETDYSLGYVEISPGNGTPFHYLLGSTEIIYVISGKGEITIDGQKHVLSSGQAVLIPAGSVQSFNNNGEDELVYLTSVQPYYQYENDILISGSLENMSYKSHPEILISNPEENQRWNPSEGVNIYAVVNPGVMDLPEIDISPEYSIAYAEFSEGAFIPFQVLTESDELDYVLEGEIEVSSGDNTYKVKKGQAVLIPKGISREFRNNSNNTTVLLSFVNPYWRDETSVSE